MAARAQEPILIGLCDGEIDKKYQSSYLTNKVGGLSDLLPVLTWQPPRCGACGSALAQVVQVYCPLQDSPYHRNLHLFACRSVACGGRTESWRVFRSQGLEAEPTAPSRPAEEPPLPATDWCDGADDWGMEGEEEEEGEGGRGGGGGLKTEIQAEEEAERPVAGQEEVRSRLQDLRLGGTEQDAPVFRPFFISVVEESDLGGGAGGLELEHAQHLLREYERREGVAVGQLESGREEGGGGGGEEKYEKSRARHGDMVFSRFMKRISVCPEQILRYCWAGTPLFVSEPPSNMAQMVPVCGRCGTSRGFELQLMPALVSLLRGRGRSAEPELEFGTVLVYTCRRSCWPAGTRSPLEEFTFLQSDPDQLLFK
ncbi:programmed cell death protein 2-like [Centroberyx gerrardi]